MNLSKTSIYAVRLMVNLAKRNRNNLVMVEDIAAEERIPKHYAAKILQRLAKFELLDSYKGRGGGFRLSKKALTISVFEILEIMDGTINLDKCLFEFRGCTNDNPCDFCKEWKSVSNEIQRLLCDYRLGDLSFKREISENISKYNKAQVFA